MIAHPLPRLAAMDPHALGPLGDRPTVQTAPVELFQGEEQYLSAKERNARRALRDVVSETAHRVLEKDEQLLYLAPAAQVPPVFHQIGLGALVYSYHQVALLFTSRRLLEILLDNRGRRASTRIRAYAWGQVRDVQVGMGGLTLMPLQGSKHKWKIRVRGDRKLLKLLVPRIRERLVGAVAAPHQAAPQAVPVWHCPVCGAALAPRPAACAACGTRFRSARTATWLAIAVPGGGLFYAGHPFLGALDLLGELLILFVVGLQLAETTGGADAAPLLGLGAVLLVATKLESVHVSHVLVNRTKPESPAAGPFWRKLAIAGGVLSAAAVIGVASLRGQLAAVVDHDLEFAAADLGWTGSRTRSEWELFADSGDMRSEWTHRDGSVVSVMAFPLGRLDTFATFAREFNRSMADKGRPPAEPLVLGSLEGLHSVTQATLDDGTPFTSIRYLIYDQSGNDVHMVVWNVRREAVSAADERLGALLARAKWIDAVPPAAVQQ